jgi:hypothetical protein
VNILLLRERGAGNWEQGHIALLLFVGNFFENFITFTIYYMFHLTECWGGKGGQLPAPYSQLPLKVVTPAELITIFIINKSISAVTNYLYVYD